MAETIPNMTQDLIKDSSDMAFMADVIETSKETPVIVDFWAPWCGPCKQLMPALERAVKTAGGKVKMVKINIDENPQIAGQLQVRSIPAVFGFKDGQPVDGFMGGQPESELNKFVARLSGDVNPADEAKVLVARAKDSLAAGDPGGAAQDFASAMSLDPESPEAIAGLARLYLEGGNDEGAAQLISAVSDKIASHPEITAIASKLSLTAAPVEDDAAADFLAAVNAQPDNLDARLELAKALAANGRNAEAVEHLLYSIAKNRAYNNEAARMFLLTIFEAEGTESDVSINGRRELSSILFA
ncbi:MAG: thioredoxin [Litorimonas sp.]